MMHAKARVRPGTVADGSRTMKVVVVAERSGVGAQAKVLITLHADALRDAQPIKPRLLGGTAASVAPQKSILGCRLAQGGTLLSPTYDQCRTASFTQ